MAVQEVLETVELLEHILSYLDTTTLVKTQRVNTCWQEVIAGSKELRRVMFVEPEQAGEVVEVEGEKRSATRLHPLLQDMLYPIIYNEASPMVTIMGFGFVEGDRILDVRCSPKALISQPPPQKAFVTYSESMHGPRGSVISSKAGVTIMAVHGELLRIMREQTEKCPEARLGFGGPTVSLHVGLDAGTDVEMLSERALSHHQQAEREYLQTEHDSESDQ